MRFQDETAFCKETRKQPPPGNAGVGCPTFTIWDEQRLGGGRGRKRERELGSVMIINYPFSKSQLCLRAGSPREGLVAHAAK
ncbi:hypothetical protein Nmel_012704 [Mimus melanotis]